MSTMLQEKPVAAQKPLQAVTAESVRGELDFVDPADLTGKNSGLKLDPADLAKVSKIADSLTKFDLKNPIERARRSGSVEGIGAAIQKKAGQSSKMLDRPIRALANAGEEGSPVAKALIELKVNVDAINPQRFNITESGGFGRFFSKLPFVGTSVNKYFTKFQSAGGVIEAILTQLHQGVEQLKRDNDMILDDQARMREITLELERVIAMAILLDRELEAKAEGLAIDSDERKFIDEEIRFPLRQRIQDLQAQLAVNQQGILSLELVRRNNLELIRGARRAENVTFTALKIAVQVALALADQKIVLRTIQAVDQTTNDLIAQNAQTLRTQGVEIHKMAAKQGLSMDVLRQAFTDINAALDDLSRFRTEALPEMKNQIQELSSLTSETEKAIVKLEKGNAVRSDVIDLDLTPANA